MSDHQRFSSSDPGAPEVVSPRPQPESQSLHKRLTFNSVSNVSRYVVSLGLAFFLTPFVVRTLGDAAYGFWVVLLSFVGYAGILELGVQPAVVKLVGQHRGTGDRAKMEELITAAFLFFVAVGVLAALFVAFVLPPVVPKLIKQFHEFERIELLFALIAADVVIMFLNYLFAGILYGWQKYHVKNLIDISAWAFNAAIVVAFLSRGGLILLAGSKAVADLMALLATAAACRRALPDIRPAPGRIKRSSFKELLGFGGKIFVSATTTRVSTNAQPLIISSQLSAAATAFFAIPVKLVDYSRQIVWALTTGFMPMFSELEGKREPALIRSLYLRYSRYVLILTVPILALIFVYGRDFIGLWISPEYAERGRYALYLLAGAALFEGLQPLLWRLFMGLGRLNLLVAVSASASLTTVILSFLLVGPMGINGVALSVLLTTGVAQVVFIRHACRYLVMSVWDMLREIQGKPLLIGCLYFVLASAIARFVGKGSYGEILVGIFLSLIVYLPMVFITLNSSEKRSLLALRRIGFLRGKKSV
jgi:O-antigen/teichoic acid export membrane protein